MIAGSVRVWRGRTVEEERYEWRNDCRIYLEVWKEGSEGEEERLE